MEETEEANMNEMGNTYNRNAKESLLGSVFELRAL